MGHSCFYIVLDGRKILIDPWLKNPMAPPNLPSLEDVDLIVVTHAHDDHLGDTIEILRSAENAKVVAIYEVAERLGVEGGIERSRLIGGNIGGPIHTDVGKLKVVLTPAVHSSPYGSPTGALLLGEEARIYHAGDTGLTLDMQLIGDLYAPDIALLPIGGHFTMDPRQAAYAVRLLRPRVAIPMHYGTFPVLYGKPEDFAEEVKKQNVNTKVVILKPGEKYEF